MPMHENTRRAFHEGRLKYKADPRAFVERNAGIVSTREGGATYAECGRLHGVSGARASQICDTAARKLKRRIKELEKVDPGDMDINAFGDIVEETLKGVVEQFGPITTHKDIRGAVIALIFSIWAEDDEEAD